MWQRVGSWSGYRERRVMSYRDEIAHLIQRVPVEIDTEAEVSGRPPSMASSEFLTNKEQGDWAEQVVHDAINQNSEEFFAVRYGHGESLAAGDPGFGDFYRAYQEELNRIGKKPDILIFRAADVDRSHVDLEDEKTISRAVAAIDVRSSSFLSARYAGFMEERTTRAAAECRRLRDEVLRDPLGSLLLQKNPQLHRLLTVAEPDSFRELSFRRCSWSSSADLRRLSDLLKQLREQIRVLHKRDYLGITPKVEDLALVNRWIRRFDVRHFYLQVFFDKAYLIAFRDILALISDSAREGDVFSIEKDVKNQGKTTIKVNVQVGKELLGRIDMPDHRSAMKELERGRLLFYVTFSGGRGYLDHEVFMREIVGDE